MPLGALIAGSVLMLLYIIPLLCLALYSAATSRWTHTLDAFTMLRMGAAFGQEHLPFLIGTVTKEIQALDDLPGVVRDISGPDDKIRQLALGVGGGPLQVSKQYMAYPGNNYRRVELYFSLFFHEKLNLLQNIYNNIYVINDLNISTSIKLKATSPHGSKLKQYEFNSIHQLINPTFE